MDTTVISKSRATRARVIARFLMSAYNRARACGKFEPNRVNKALGLAYREMITGKVRPYTTTIKSCTCPDSRKGHICKHRIAKMIITRANEGMRAAAEEAAEQKRLMRIAEQENAVAFQMKLHEAARR